MTTCSGTLPPTFRSLYRLFLRTAAASVLYKRPATRRIRRLWRPTFDSAASVLHSLQQKELAEMERQRLQRLYCVWESRMDNTLSLLAVSARSRGLPHRLTRNLNFLLRAHNRYLEVKLGAFNEYRHYWNPQLPPTSERYEARSAVLGSRANRKEDKKERWRTLDERAWGALGEAIIMAEGKDGVSLGRIKNGIRREFVPERR